MTPTFFFGGLGFALVGYGVWRWRLAGSMRRWPKTTGRIERLVEQKRIHSEAGISLPYYLPKMEVAYGVGGTVYRTTRFSPHNFTIGFPGELRELLKGVAVGSSVDVYYDPHFPNRSVILLPSHDGALVAIFIGGIIATIAALVAAS